MNVLYRWCPADSDAHALGTAATSSATSSSGWITTTAAVTASSPTRPASRFIAASTSAATESVPRDARSMSSAVGVRLGVQSRVRVNVQS